MPYEEIKKFPSVLEAAARDAYAKLPRNISDADIAKATGLTNSWINHFVKGKSRFADAGRIEALLVFCTNKPIKFD